MTTIYSGIASTVNLPSERNTPGRGLSAPCQGSGQANSPGHPHPMAAVQNSGGRVTISPPSNIIDPPGLPLAILASGVDALRLAINVTWADESFFEYLQIMKDRAKEEEKEGAVIIGDRERQPLALVIKPYGSKGYEWVLHGSDYTMTIGNWLEPQSRPSIMAGIRSETLWALGPETALEILLTALRFSGAKIQSIKPSQVDLCVDYLMPGKLWSARLLKYKVTRATQVNIHTRHNVLTGVSIGKGKIAARLYDKPLEIEQKSKKFWMYDVWGIKEVPAGYRIIRIEGQFRREVLKNLGLENVDDLFAHLDNLWAHFTRKWLEFKSSPHKQHRIRKPLPFWLAVQNGFMGVQGALPLLRCRSLQTQKRQLAAQAYGLLNSFVAVDQEERGSVLGHETELKSSFSELGDYFDRAGKNDFVHGLDILDKRAKLHKVRAKMAATSRQRRKMGFPCNLPVMPDSQD